MEKALLGLPLDEALAFLERHGIGPVRVTQSCAPRRDAAVGTLRVVKVQGGGRSLVVCGFLDEVKGDADAGREG